MTALYIVAGIIVLAVAGRVGMRAGRWYEWRVVHRQIDKWRREKMRWYL
jgi:hypothetical protein